LSTDQGTLDLVFVWHMHQPDYRDRAQRRILLPWARLHALKDYYDMPARLSRFEGIHQTFNLVPSLIEQIECYQTGTWREGELDLFLRPSEDLNENEKHLILKSFFLAPEERMVRPYPRYASLLRDYRLKGACDVIQRWSAQEWRDLQFWRQLSWIDPMLRDLDSSIEELFRWGQNFEESRKEELLERMNHWMEESLQIYRRLSDEGRIEISVTPFYHPILPLLIDPTSAREAMPDCPLHESWTRNPEDARAQVEKAIAFYEQRFGRKPRGMWPSEGSVSQETAKLLQETGIEWFASDEEILGHSLGQPLRISSETHPADERLYLPYATLGGQGPAILFRDHRLSDLIGFRYATWDPEVAASHLIGEILSVRKTWKGPGTPLVTIILDGENCWEYYDKDGGPFLDALYHLIQETPEIRCCTVSEALEGRERIPLSYLSAGSWINGNFFIWMGEEADRKAWGLLQETRTALAEAARIQKVSQETLTEAWEELYVAEGSDWFWWFGDSQQSHQDALFDELFRLHLLRVYDLIDVESPTSLHNPVEAVLSERTARMDPHLVASPIIDGLETHYYEWCAAARFEPSRQGGAMQQVGKLRIDEICYGVDENWFYLRVDPSSSYRRSKVPWRYELRVTGPTPMRLRFISTGDGMQIMKAPLATMDSPIGERLPWIEVPSQLGIAKEKTVLEASLSWEILESHPGEVLSFFVGCPAGGDEVEIVPPLSSLYVTTPGKDRPGRHWFP
jgi:alpha-amylase/alpha-mannosidase (GH57 family)